jgi:predicted lipoprotein
VRRRVALLVLCAGAAHAADWRREAVPFYTPRAFVDGLYRGALQPRAAAFAEAAAALERALRAHCGGPGDLLGARRQYAAAVEHWEALSAIVVGPLLQRRSARRIDFRPTRPASIEKAIAQAPDGDAAMQRIGAPAKGLPALEWLLWSKTPLAPRAPACDYAVQAAADVAREAVALRQAFAEPPADDAAAFAEALNQWIGGATALGWQRIDKPLRAGEPFAYAPSGLTARAWSARWQALRDLAATSAAPPRPDGSAPVTLEQYLRGRGLNPLADRLAAAAARADTALRRAASAKRDTLRAASAALAALRKLVEDEVAPALQVSIGFSDADGD